jgi:hypothetical protein
VSADDTAVLRAVAAYGLPEASLVLSRQTLDDRAWSAVLQGAAHHRITGHLARALDDGVLPATDFQVVEALEHHERALGLDLVLERLLLTAVRSLETAGIPTRVLKGPAVAHTVYPDPGLRSFGDVDLLVPARDYDAALIALTAGGTRRRHAEPRRGFDRRFGKGACLETPEGLELDLHRTFVAGPFGLSVETEELFATGCAFSLGGRCLVGLDREARFIHACFHAALGDAVPRLVALRDVAEMALHSDVGLARTQELCDRWRCGIVVQRAARLAWDMFAITVVPDLVEWSWRHEPSAFEQRSLEAYVGPRRSYARQAVAGLWAVRGLASKAAYVSALLAPTAPYVRARDGGYVRRLRRAAGLFRDELAERWLRRPGSA